MHILDGGIDSPVGTKQVQVEYKSINEIKIFKCCKTRYKCQRIIKQ